jgi:lipoprotein-anchoring transpeptidase ErfK/SrfK
MLMPPRYRIIVDLSQLMLHLLEGDTVVKSYPVGIGTIASASPEGLFKIINKQPNPGGPFGVFWMGLSKPHYGIHGTNRPDSIGKRSSHGCIRMHNADVLDLAAKVSVGTEVRIRK